MLKWQKRWVCFFFKNDCFYIEKNLLFSWTPEKFKQSLQRVFAKDFFSD